MRPNLRQRYPDAYWHFGLLSAWDPYSIQRPEPVNRSADDALHCGHRAGERLQLQACVLLGRRTVHGREPSWLVVDMPVDRFDALSRSHGQLATLYWPAHSVVRDARGCADNRRSPSGP